MGDSPNQQGIHHYLVESGEIGVERNTAVLCESAATMPNSRVQKAYVPLQTTLPVMPSSNGQSLLTAIRVSIGIVGIGIAALTVFRLATMPPPPPESDGFAHGMAAIFGGAILIISFGVATVSIVLPTLLGRDDPLGFTGWQRLALKAAGGLIGGGIVLGLAYGMFTRFLNGILLWIGFLALAAVVVTATLVWRLGEVLLDRLAPTGSTEIS